MLQPIPPEWKRIIKMVSPSGFNDLVFSYMDGTRSQKDAYYLAEEEYYNIFKTNRYSSYNSYRVTRDKFLKAKYSKK